MKNLFTDFAPLHFGLLSLLLVELGSLLLLVFDSLLSQALLMR